MCRYLLSCEYKGTLYPYISIYDVEATPEELAAREADMLQQAAEGGSIEALENQDGVQQFNEALISHFGWFKADYRLISG